MLGNRGRGLRLQFNWALVQVGFVLEELLQFVHIYSKEEM
jgi:hypothetical protein